MRHDIFEFCTAGMTRSERAVRIIFLLVCIAVCALDLFVWRP